MIKKYNLENLLYKVQKNSKQGYNNIHGEIIIPCIYDFTHYDTTEKVVIVNYGDKFGCFDELGVEIYSMEYDLIRPFYSGVAVYKKNNEYGYLKKDMILTKPIFSFADDFTYGLGKVGTSFGQNIIDSTGAYLLPLNNGYYTINLIDELFVRVTDIKVLEYGSKHRDLYVDIYCGNNEFVFKDECIKFINTQNKINKILIDK